MRLVFLAPSFLSWVYNFVEMNILKTLQNPGEIFRECLKEYFSGKVAGLQL